MAANKENEIILNTPNRNEILKAGPPRSWNSNVLGRGAYGTVFKATFRGKNVAVKIVRNLKNRNLESMRSEANILGWRHRHIVRILKIETTADFGIVIMERLPGQCLQFVLDSVDLPLCHRVVIASDILSALAYCHRRGLLHLDVKPQNILVAFGHSRTSRHQPNTLLYRKLKYVCKLCDFGASTKVSDQQENASHGVARGTVRYMAPEALSAEPLTGAADIYSLGITMWQLQHRQTPYSWIECNEVVAYQVVKHSLRPDYDAPFNRSFSFCEGVVNQTLDSCYCKNCAPCKSLSQTKKVLYCNQNKNYSAASDLVEQSRRASSSFKSFKQRINASVARDLLLEFSSITTTEQLDQCDGAENFDPTTIFRPFTAWREHTLVHKEEAYRAIYTSCWHSDYRSRPSALQLCERLERLL